ncbi:hypothetical protein IQ276_029570 [Desmonostoc muscorum LEGE 12446]|uniref:Uncharacterized protein n=1 Tax=Desmonostoc muscorum LEGE 12446 TaxID=1828758 RepID=A0A8J7DJM3_DESMC|nr:hypothetical protein [Desmonostoc muscorum]MCF2150500.1 hypothetical protein [Desmonostoc muscorum LEGE 12446]
MRLKYRDRFGYRYRRYSEINYFIKIFSYDHWVKDRLIQLGTIRCGAPVLTLRLIEIKVGKTSYSDITSVLEESDLTSLRRS